MLQFTSLHHHYKKFFLGLILFFGAFGGSSATLETSDVKSKSEKPLPIMTFSKYKRNIQGISGLADGALLLVVIGLSVLSYFRTSGSDLFCTMKDATTTFFFATIPSFGITFPLGLLTRVLSFFLLKAQNDEKIEHEKISAYKRKGARTVLFVDTGFLLFNIIGGLIVYFIWGDDLYSALPFSDEFKTYFMIYSAFSTLSTLLAVIVRYCLYNLVKV